jgi:hypothetical protein
VQEVRFDETHEEVVARDPITMNVTSGQHPVMLLRASMLTKHSAEDVITLALLIGPMFGVSCYRVFVYFCPFVRHQ